MKRDTGFTLDSATASDIAFNSELITGQGENHSLENGDTMIAGEFLDGCEIVASQLSSLSGQQYSAEDVANDYLNRI